MQTHATIAAKLKGSLSEAFNSLKRLDEEIYTLKNDLVENSDIYFERAKD